MMMIDCHTHVGTHHTFSETPDEMIQSLRSSGLSGMLSCPMSGTMAADEKELIAGNEEALVLHEKHPDFLYPGTALHPLYPEKSIYYLEKFGERGLFWTGENLSYHCEIPFDDERWLKLFRICNERHLVVQLHNAPDVVKLAAALPELTIVGSHLNPEVLPQLVQYENVYIDISGFHGGLCRGTIPRARSLFGAQRLLFGSDFPGYDVEPFILRVKQFFPESEQADVFAGNLLNLMKKHNMFWEPGA